MFSKKVYEIVIFLNCFYGYFLVLYNRGFVYKLKYKNNEIKKMLNVCI